MTGKSSGAHLNLPILGRSSLLAARPLPQRTLTGVRPLAARAGKPGGVLRDGDTRRGGAGMHPAPPVAPGYREPMRFPQPRRAVGRIGHHVVDIPHRCVQPRIGPSFQSPSIAVSPRPAYQPQSRRPSGCRCATPSCGQPGARSDLPVRWPRTVDNRARSLAPPEPRH